MTIASRPRWLSRVKCSVGDPDPKDPHHFAGSGSITFSTDPDPDSDLNLAYFPHPYSPHSHLIVHLSSLTPPPPWIRINMKTGIRIKSFRIRYTALMIASLWIHVTGSGTPERGDQEAGAGSARLRGRGGVTTVTSTNGNIGIRKNKMHQN